jgi:hypothetical protein
MPIVMKYGSLKLLEPSAPVQVYNGMLYLYVCKKKHRLIQVICV